MKFTLEIAAFSLEGALIAQEAGAHRIELCENPAEGGTTPSYGSLKIIRNQVSIPIFQIIRPRGGDFLYSEIEFSIMKQDVQLCKHLGFEGVVLGLLNKDGHIDTQRTSMLVDIAYPMEVTFHRAFDRSLHPLEAITQIRNTGCSRILTSGQQPLAMDGAELIAALVTEANGSIEIMPGSGVHSGNIEALAIKTGAVAFHASARIPVASRMKYGVSSMNETLQHTGVNGEEVTAMLDLLKKMELHPDSGYFTKTR